MRPIFPADLVRPPTPPPVASVTADVVVVGRDGRGLVLSERAQACLYLAVGRLVDVGADRDAQVHSREPKPGVGLERAPCGLVDGRRDVDLQRPGGELGLGVGLEPGRVDAQLDVVSEVNRLQPVAGLLAEPAAGRSKVDPGVEVHRFEVSPSLAVEACGVRDERDGTVADSEG
ncbi:hypothetical protein ACFOJ6_20835 [Gordonia humi]|uniref:hypothetical protein n=1 Tax=Gordonia humi TaxID=686429 RepID=UPI003608A84B